MKSMAGALHAALPECDAETLAPPMSVLVVRDADALERYAQQWQDLASHAIEPNPFYEPWMLIPALRSFGREKDLRAVLVFSGQDESILCGVFPLEKKSRYKGLPVAAFSFWQHIYCALCTPLIRSEYARECLDVFFEWLNTEGGCALMEFNLVSADGGVQRLLNDRLIRGKDQSLVSGSYERALFLPMESADQYLRAALRRDHRKDLRRRTRRLGEKGQLEFDSLECDGDIDTWTQEFLELEARGW